MINIVQLTFYQAIIFDTFAFMITVSPKDISTREVHAHLLGAVSPRPIAFASTADSEGNVNLAPFSFFNVFSANPPIVVFSPARRGRDNTTKHTYENLKKVKEVVINIVNYDMVQQVSLASTDYEEKVNEFVKAGFTETPSEKIRPPRVAEAPVQMECVVRDIIELGSNGGAGNLVICEVVLFHIKEEILDENGTIDPFKIDTVSRLGGNWYSRSKNGLFTVPKPLTTIGIGIDQLPENIRNSRVLTGNDLGMLANVERLPATETIIAFLEDKTQAQFIEEATAEEVHRCAQELLCDGKIATAWNVLMAKEIKLEKK